MCPCALHCDHPLLLSGSHTEDTSLWGNKALFTFSNTQHLFTVFLTGCVCVQRGGSPRDQNLHGEPQRRTDPGDDQVQQVLVSLLFPSILGSPTLHSLDFPAILSFRYPHLCDLVQHFFPPLCGGSEAVECPDFSSATYWKEPLPPLDLDALL